MTAPPPASEIARYYHTHTGPMTHVMAEVCRLARNEAVALRQQPIFEALERATAWMRSLSKLDSESDVQAIHAACRTLLELAVDAALLHHDNSERSVNKLLAFEQSQRLTAANAYDAYIKRTKRSPGPGFQLLLDFGQQQRDAIKAQRRQEWGSVDHPARWSGCNAGFLGDVIAADEQARWAMSLSVLKLT